jgi:hypothetical protein
MKRWLVLAAGVLVVASFILSGLAFCKTARLESGLGWLKYSQEQPKLSLRLTSQGWVGSDFRVSGIVRLKEPFVVPEITVSVEYSLTYQDGSKDENYFTTKLKDGVGTFENQCCYGTKSDTKERPAFSITQAQWYFERTTPIEIELGQ